MMSEAFNIDPQPCFQVGATTHAGHRRTANEDSYFVDADLGVFAVADGMGGHESGALASSLIVDSLSSIGTPVSAADLLARLEDRVLRVNETIHALARDKQSTIGSTIAVLLAYENDYACVWSGDSRVYRVRDGAITMLSRDHTEIGDLLERGVLSPEEAKVSPRRHVITRAIGVAASPELELAHGLLEEGDTFVICSDGLTEHVDEGEILALVSGAQPQPACDALVALTLERGASDNVTVVVAQHCRTVP